MKSTQYSNQAPDIVTEACAWIAQLETGDLTTADLEAFREWIGRSPRHASEIKRLAILSEQLNTLTDLAEPMREATASYQPIVSKRANRWGWLSIESVGAAFAAVMLAVTVVLTSSLLSTNEPIMLATPVGGYLEQELSDGSVVKLNTDSQIEVLFDRERRRITLHKGEVLFDVAHNPQRPFLVRAGDREVQAVGTVFVVRLQQQKFEVVVTEGVVKVAEVAVEPVVGTDVDPVSAEIKELKVASRPVFLKASQALSILDEIKKPIIKTMAESEIERQLTWRMGYLEFTDMTLDEVIQELSRHTNLNIEIVDPDIKSIKFDGIFPTGDAKLIFEALEAGYDIQVEYIGSDTVRVGGNPSA